TEGGEVIRSRPTWRSLGQPEQNLAFRRSSDRLLNSSRMMESAQASSWGAGCHRHSYSSNFGFRPARAANISVLQLRSLFCRTALRVAVNVNRSESFGTFWIKGVTIQPRPAGMSLVNEIASH